MLIAEYFTLVYADCTIKGNLTKNKCIGNINKNIPVG